MRRSRSFATERERDAFARELAKIRAARGKSATIATAEQVDTWRAFARLTGNADPLEVARFWVQHKTAISGTARLGDTLEAYFQALRSAGHPLTSHHQLHLRRMLEYFGPGRQIGDIQPEALGKWLDSLGFEHVTRRHHLKSARSFFKRLVRMRLAPENPADAVPMPHLEAEEVTVLSVADTRRLFEVNRDALCIGRLALEAFGGLRYTSAARMRAAVA